MENHIDIIKNEISQLNNSQAEQDLLTKELVKETQENYKSMLLLKSMIRNQADMMRSSIRIDELDPAKGTLSSSDFINYHDSNKILSLNLILYQ